MSGGLRTENKCPSEAFSSMVIAFEVVSVKRRTEGNGKNQGLFYVVECCKDSQVTRSKKYRCGERGFDDPDARLKALRFGFFSEGLVAFRNFLFGEGLKGSEGFGRNGSCFVCVRRSHVSGMLFAAAVLRAGNGVIRGVSFAGEEDAAIQRALGFVKGPEIWNWVRKILGLQVQGSGPGACKHCGQQMQQQQEQEQDDTQFGKQLIFGAFGGHQNTGLNVDGFIGTQSHGHLDIPLFWPQLIVADSDGHLDIPLAME